MSFVVILYIKSGLFLKNNASFANYCLTSFSVQNWNKVSTLILCQLGFAQQIKNPVWGQQTASLKVAGLISTSCINRNLLRILRI